MLLLLAPGDVGALQRSSSTTGRFGYWHLETSQAEALQNVDLSDLNGAHLYTWVERGTVVVKPLGRWVHHREVAPLLGGSGTDIRSISGRGIT